MATDASATPREGSVMGYGADARAMMQRRTATQVADILLPHLRPGMRLLDAGFARAEMYTVGAIIAEIRAWSLHPDAMCVTPIYAAIGT